MFKINNLIIIGGPSCSGKSSIIERIQRRECPFLCQQLGLTDSHECLCVSRRVDLKRINQRSIERLIVHYDFFAHYWGKGGYIFLNDLLSNSNSVIILTLYTYPKELIRRINQRIIFCYILKFCRRETGYSVKNLWKKRKEYKDGFSLPLLYAKWFDLLQTYNISTYLKLQDGKPENSCFAVVDCKVADWSKVFDNMESDSNASWLSTALMPVKK